MFCLEHESSEPSTHCELAICEQRPSVETHKTLDQGERFLHPCRQIPCLLRETKKHLVRIHIRNSQERQLLLGKMNAGPLFTLAQ